MIDPVEYASRFKSEYLTRIENVLIPSTYIYLILAMCHSLYWTPGLTGEQNNFHIHCDLRWGNSEKSYFYQM